MSSLFDKGIEKVFSSQTCWKSKNYRKLRRIRIVTTIISYLTQPYYYLKGVYIGWKLKRQYPDRWERYVKVQEINRAAEKSARRTENWAALNSGLLMFRLCILAKVANATGQTKEPFSEEFAETMDRGIEEYRQDVLKILAAIETDGGTETARLTEMMNKVKVDEFKSVEGDFAEFVDASDEALHGIIY